MSGLDNTSYTVRTETATGGTLSANDSVLIMTNAAAKALAIQSAALAIPGRQYTVVNGAATGNITITPAAGTIDGAATLAVLPSSTVTVISAGSNWVILSESD